MNDQAAIGSKLELRYADALGAYLKTGDEAALVRAYELGRQVMDSGGGVLELTAMHEAAFEVVVATRYRTLSLSVAVKRSFEFLGEGLAPFEMAQRGFREANLRLLNANEQLAKRSEELSAANDRLEVTNIVIERDRAVLAAVIASMTDGLVVADAGGRITAANDRAGELLGTGCAQLIGQDLTAVAARLEEVLPDQPALHELRERLLSATSETERFELHTTTPPAELLIELFAVRDEDRTGLGVVLRDMTSERELAQAKDELVTVVSHELREPLTSIIGFAELLVHAHAGDPKHAEQAGIIVAEGRRLAALIDEFLDLQRIDRGADRIAARELDLPALLARLASVTGTEHTHQLVIDAPADLPAAWADAERIWQVLINLVSNAAKYSPKGSEIRVAARAVDRAIEVSVVDQGIGIEAAAIPHLFGEFFRVKSPDRQGIRGTGLGLSICRKIVRAHRGQIWAESEGPGKGATFRFTLPVV